MYKEEELKLKKEALSSEIQFLKSVSCFMKKDNKTILDKDIYILPESGRISFM